MSSCSHEQAWHQSVEEMAQLIAELHDLRMRVRRAEATALAGRHVAASSEPASVGGCGEAQPSDQRAVTSLPDEDWHDCDKVNEAAEII